MICISMKNIVLAGMSLLFLSGCIDYQAREDFVKEKEQCEAKYPKFVGNYSKLARCLDMAGYKLAAKDSSSYKEVSYVAQARDPIYRDIDAKKVSPEEGEELYNIAYEEAKARFNSEREQALMSASQEVINANNARQSHCTYTGGYGTTYQNCY